MNSIVLMVLIGLVFASVTVLAASLLGARQREATSKAVFVWLVDTGVNAAVSLSWVRRRSSMSLVPLL